MPNPLMRVMLNNTINKNAIRTPEEKEVITSSNLREEQAKLLKKILEKDNTEIVSGEDGSITDKCIKMITLEELRNDYQTVEPIEEKRANKNLVSLASIGKLYKEVK